VVTSGILRTDALAVAQKTVAVTPNRLMLDQFTNPANPALHRRTTATEIWNGTEGDVDFFVSAVGTGGRITDAGELLKQRKSGARAEPAGTALLCGGIAGKHQMPGIGVGFIAKVLNRKIIDEVIAVADEEAFASPVKFFAKSEKINNCGARARSQKRQRGSTPNVCFLEIADGERARIRHTRCRVQRMSIKASALGER
jgi:cysteine synthase